MQSSTMWSMPLVLGGGRLVARATGVEAPAAARRAPVASKAPALPAPAMNWRRDKDTCGDSPVDEPVPAVRENVHEWFAGVWSFVAYRQPAVARQARPGPPSRGAPPRPNAG